MDTQRLGYVSLERLAGAGAARVRLQPAAPVKAELTQEDIVEEPEWPSLAYDEIVDARQAAGSLTHTWTAHAKWPAELAQRWPPRLGRGRRPNMSAFDVAAMQNEVLTRTAPQPQNAANKQGKGPSNKRPRAEEPSDPDTSQSGSDSELPSPLEPSKSHSKLSAPLEPSKPHSELPAPQEPSSRNDGSGSPLHTSALIATTDSVPSALLGASQGTVLRRSKRLRAHAGSPTPMDEPGSLGSGPATVTKPAVTPLAAAQSQSVNARHEQGRDLRRSKRLASSPVLVDDSGSPGGVPAPVTQPALTPSVAADSQSAGTCQEQDGLVSRHRRAKTGLHGAGGGSPEASAISAPPADTSLYAWPKRILTKSSAGQDAAGDGSAAADAGRAVGKKSVSAVPEDLSARVIAILASSDLHQITMRQVMERLEIEGGLGVLAKSVKKEVDRYLMQVQGTGTGAAVEATASQDADDTLWKVSIEDELNTDFRDLRPAAASHEEDRATLPIHSQLQPDAADAPPDLQAAALALHWALISLAGAHLHAAGPAAPAASAGMTNADLAHGQPMSHPHSGPGPTAAELSASVAGAPADKTSSQPMSLHPFEAPPAAANASKTGAAAAVSLETDEPLAAPQAGLLTVGLPARPEVVEEAEEHGARAPNPHVMPNSAGDNRKDVGEGSEAMVSEPGSEVHAAEQAAPDAAADRAAGDASPSDAEDDHLDHSISRAADETFGLVYVLLEHLLARRWTYELRPHFGPTSRLTFSLLQLSKFGTARPPRPPAVPAGARSGPAEGGPSPTTAGDPRSITEGGPSYQTDSAAEPREPGDGITHGPAPHEESAGYPKGNSPAGVVEQSHAEVPCSSVTGQRHFADATHMLESGIKEAQKKSAAGAPYGSIGGDARLVFEAAAAVGMDANSISCAVQRYQRLIHGNPEDVVT